MTMNYCPQCQKVRGFPKTEMTQTAVQCDFCDKAICKCYQGTYAALVGLERNPDTYKTSGGSIRVDQGLSLPEDLPVTKIHPGLKKSYMNDKMIIVFENKMRENGSHSLAIVNRQTGEQIVVQM